MVATDVEEGSAVDRWVATVGTGVEGVVEEVVEVVVSGKANPVGTQSNPFVDCLGSGRMVFIKKHDSLY